jgi:hypothetical protein
MPAAMPINAPIIGEAKPALKPTMEVSSPRNMK